MRRRALIVGNWKMNGLIETGRGLAREVLAGLTEREERKLLCEVVVCPPFTGLADLNQILGSSSLKLGGQDMSEYPSGAHTGEIAGIMLRNVGCWYVILGHSERRAERGEDDALIGRKTAAAFRDGLVPIVCLGETLSQREQSQTLEVIEAQLLAVLPHLPDSVSKIQQLVVAYEPVWAIGTGKNATPQQVQEVHAFIRKLLAEQLGEGSAAKIRILYGGSVKPDNAADLFGLDDVDGGLIGGASLNATDFLAIVDAYPNDF
ncbi:MAG: triose-phosphate isomerase [Magnetococcales bacterium]|nr:triose-phosphate isomerase [Magnetococcales bacterium]